jgi:hypothetical protein
MPADRMDEAGMGVELVASQCHAAKFDSRSAGPYWAWGWTFAHLVIGGPSKGGSPTLRSNAVQPFRLHGPMSESSWGTKFWSGCFEPTVGATLEPHVPLRRSYTDEVGQVPAAVDRAAFDCDLPALDRLTDGVLHCSPAHAGQGGDFCRWGDRRRCDA